MIRNFKSMVGAKVLEQGSGDLLATISGVVVNPDSGVLEAFWVKPETLLEKIAILKISDILELKKNLYIRSDKVLAQAEDIIRISEILEDGRELIGNSVQNEAGDTYGTCYDLTFDVDTYGLKQIYARKSFLGLVPMDERIFSFESIIKVLPDMILVNDDAAKKETIIVTTPEAAAG